MTITQLVIELVRIVGSVHRAMPFSNGPRLRRYCRRTAAALDGSLLVAYVPPDGAASFEVDLRAMRGPARARWFDPTDGSWRAIADALPNGAAHAFRLPGRNAAKERDWVLVLDAAPPGAVPASR